MQPEQQASPVLHDSLPRSKEVQLLGLEAQQAKFLPLCSLGLRFPVCSSEVISFAQWAELCKLHRSLVIRG